MADIIDFHSAKNRLRPVPVSAREEPSRTFLIIEIPREYAHRLENTTVSWAARFDFLKD